MTKNIIVTAIIALVVSLGVGTFFVGSQQSNGINLGADRVIVDSHPNGIKIGAQTFNTTQVNLKAGVNTNFWKNTTGRTQYVYLGEFTTTGTASTSFTYGIATTSAGTVASDFANPAWSSIINATVLATSSAATTTSSLQRALLEKVIPVAANQYVTVWLRQTNPNPCSGSACETATSTNRGFNVTGRLFYHD